MLTCWSCMFYRPDGCLQNLTQYRQTNSGPDCPWFCYEPGADEKVNEEEQT